MPNDTNTLGSSDITVSRFAVGTMTFGEGEFHGFEPNIAQDAANEFIEMAIARGVTLFDTANEYSDGQAETILGRALGDRRSDVSIATKGGVKPDVGDDEIEASLREQIEQSLDRLGTDHLDLYQVHFFDKLASLEPVAKALDTFAREGLTKAIGITNQPAWRLAKLRTYQDEHGLTPIASYQGHASLIDRTVEGEVLPAVQAHGLGFLAWSPLASGFLTGKYTKDDPDGSGGRLKDFVMQPIDRDRGYSIVEKVRAIANAHDATPAQVSLAWLAGHKGISSVLIGASSLAHLKENLDAADLELTDDERGALDDVSAPTPTYPNWLYAAQ